MWETAVAEARHLRLPLHRDMPKNWDALGAVGAVLTDRLRDGEAAEGGDGHLRGAAADVNHERSDRLCDRQPGTDRGRERLFDQVGAGCARRQRRLLDRRTLDLSRTARDADHYLGA